MKNRTYIALAWLSLLGSASAQDSTQNGGNGGNDGIVGPLPAVGVACYKLQDPANQCVITSKPIVNYTQPQLNVIDMNGAWQDQSGNRPYIYLYGDSNYAAGYTIMFDQSLMNRPDGFGYFIDGTTIQAVFPDDKDYTGTVGANGRQIRWSNNTVWTKL